MEYERKKFIYEEGVKLQQQKLEKEMFYRQATIMNNAAYDEATKIEMGSHLQNITQTTFLQTSMSPSPDRDLKTRTRKFINKTSSKKDFRYQIDSDIFVSKNESHPTLFQQSRGSMQNLKQVNIIQGQPKFLSTFSSQISKEQFQPVLDMKDKTFKTPGQIKKNMQMVVQNMFQACRKGNWNYIEKNRDRLGVQVLQTSKDEKGNTCLYVAVANKQLETARYLLDKGVVVNSRNENGNTPLHRAFMNQDYAMIGLLQQYGANFDLVNDLNQTALYFGSRVLIEKLGIKNKPVNYVSMNELQKDKAQQLIKKATKIVNDNPNQFVEENESKDKVLKGVVKRLESKEVMNDFAPLYQINKIKE